MVCILKVQREKKVNEKKMKHRKKKKKLSKTVIPLLRHYQEQTYTKDINSLNTLATQTHTYYETVHDNFLVN